MEGCLRESESRRVRAGPCEPGRSQLGVLPLVVGVQWLACGKERGRGGGAVNLAEQHVPCQENKMREALVTLRGSLFHGSRAEQQQQPEP